MSDTIHEAASPEAVEQELRDLLDSGDEVIATARPILHHLLANRDYTLFSDEVVARVRGMVLHVARQLLLARAEAGNEPDPGAFVDRQQDALASMFHEDPAFLSLAHSLTLELQVAELLQRRSGIDCVLSPLLQELAADSDPELAASAMRLMAAQARFIQQERRMELPLGELPGEMFHRALLLMRTQAGDVPDAAAAEARLRSEFDEGQGRLGQISRLLMNMARRATRALSIDHAGLAIFSSALAMASGQGRNLVIFSFSENQIARLALALRAAGLKQAAMEEQFLYLHPEIALPENLERLGSDRAEAILSCSQAAVLG